MEIPKIYISVECFIERLIFFGQINICNFEVLTNI